jgi:hypothetical protein
MHRYRIRRDPASETGFQHDIQADRPPIPSEQIRIQWRTWSLIKLIDLLLLRLLYFRMALLQPERKTAFGMVCLKK